MLLLRILANGRGGGGGADGGGGLCKGGGGGGGGTPLFLLLPLHTGSLVTRRREGLGALFPQDCWLLLCFLPLPSGMRCGGGLGWLRDIGWSL